MLQYHHHYNLIQLIPDHTSDCVCMPTTAVTVSHAYTTVYGQLNVAFIILLSSISRARRR